VGVHTPAVSILATANSSPLCPSLLFCKRRVKKGNQKSRVCSIPFPGSPQPPYAHHRAGRLPTSLPLPTPPPRREAAAAWGSKVAAAAASTAFAPRKGRCRLPPAAPRQGKAAPFRSQLAQYEPERGANLATRAPNPNQQQLTLSLVSIQPATDTDPQWGFLFGRRVHPSMPPWLPEPSSASTINRLGSG